MRFALAQYGAAAAAPPAPVSNYVLFGGGSSEFTLRTPGGLPSCPSNTWYFNDPATYDSISSCTSKSSTQISVNVFRCAQYSATATKGVVGCAKCYYAWNYAAGNPKQVQPWASAIEAKAARVSALEGYFVPQTIRDKGSMQSCFLTNDPSLASLCDSIDRSAIDPRGSQSWCVKQGVKTPFGYPLQDNDGCSKYAKYQGKIYCYKWG
ncbi:Aste57867_12209 [Aphanomyces stellatus]|uniref:Aste57867_12209 protein n=1 Tax=Aphanomyces stellatus TaxID=120398 RepID=A0A485KUY9_9STRA|nr:hypothetical protein As57867_012164 [Aphanomyces stellatus]VFT89063.1 Aste57867_12209 [Aphanomyces stellatus]